MNHLSITIKIAFPTKSQSLIYALLKEIRTWSHFYAEIFTNQSKKSRGKLDFSIRIHWHVHSYKFFVSEPIGALVSKAERWIHVFKHIEHFRVENFPTA